MSKYEQLQEITMTYQEQALALSNQYGLGQTGISIKPIGSGHINTTLLLSSPEKHLVVQKLNTQVFPDSQALVSNARKIEKHLTKKAQKNAYDLDVIKHVATQDETHLVRLNGDTWRALEFIGGSYSEDVVESSEKAKIAAGAFGQFAKALNDFEADSLKTVIPDFHNLAMRVNALEEAVSADKVARVNTCAAEIEFCQQQRQLLDEIADIVPDLPVRACHNDTKINNMLFCKKSDQAKAVIDLDTCMPGYWMFDFGDMVRTFCSPEAEDSTNLDKVKVREHIFASIVEGYVEPLKNVLSEKEKQSFWLGAKVMSFMIGVRFLTDYLDGDNYFTIHRDNHNLDRARNQFALYKDLLKKEQTLKEILFK
ncbi:MULTISPECIES: phosphotransferase enzyme family protein [Pseudoalteromonas]|uniref:phosphotransferase enzyme family protein n=1 Tax=Pseudoalteromonas TaxID=53246 RepID=UPI001F3DB345|nr:MULTISPECIES: aminoglycoside phosphotransferase family protein [Pseudoalteromonas]